MTSSTSSSEALPAALPSRSAQWRDAGKLVLRTLLPLFVVGILACLGLDWVVRHQLIEATPSHGAAKLYRIQEPHPGEIPIIGSSRALCSFIPDSLGPDYYNYGINGIGFAVMDILLKRALARPDKGPIVLNFDYEMFFYQMGDVNSYLPHTNLPEVRPLLRRSGQYDAYMEIPGIRYFGAMDAFMKDRLNERLQLTKAMNRGAAIDKAPFSAQQFAVKVKQRTDSVMRWSPRKELVDTLFARIRSHPEREFVIVIAPYHKSYYAAMEPLSFAPSDRLLAALDAEPNARLIQWDTQTWPDEEFMNTTHVGMTGAIHATRLLREALATPPQNATPTQDSMPAATPITH